MKGRARDGDDAGNVVAALEVSVRRRVVSAEAPQEVRNKGHLVEIDDSKPPAAEHPYTVILERRLNWKRQVSGQPDAACSYSTPSRPWSG